jgi:sulfate permease, SulP family
MPTNPPPLHEPPRERRWQHRAGQGGRTIAAALAHAPENAAYGLMAMAPLGAAFGPGAMMLTLVGAVVANALATLLGGGRLVSGPRASLALLTAGFVAALVERLGPHVDPWTAPLLLACALLVAGGLQTAFGLMRFGGIVKFTPYPVRLGLASGIGLLLLLSALPVALGHGFGAGWQAMLLPVETGAAAVAAVSWLVAWGAGRYAARLPAALLGLAAGTALHAVLASTMGAATLGPPIGVPAVPAGVTEHLRAAAIALDPQLLRSLLPLLASYALTVAVLCSLDTLLATSIVDGRLRTSRDADRELVAQGLSNIASALAGGQAASPSVPRSVALMSGGRPAHRHAVLGYAFALAAVVVTAPFMIGLLPSSALGGILVAQALPMVAPALWRTPLELWSRRNALAGSGDWDEGQRRLLAANWAVGGAVALGAVLFGLGPAVLLGAGFAVILFVRANMRDVVRRSVNGQQRRSLKMRPPGAAEGLRREGDRIAVLELEGALFFGTADALRVRLQALPPRVEAAILDLHQVQEIDVTGARILFETAEDWRRSGRRLVLAEWAAGDLRRRAVEAVAGAAADALSFVDTTDLALEQVEDALIARLALATEDTRTLDLAQATLARGLDVAELALLAADLEPVRFAAGEVMFRQGDPGDALYIVVKGEIGLRMPGSQRRLASFAPGVTVGEMAVLAHGVRSAEAQAESDVVALRLTVEAFDRMKQSQPALAAKILNNVALHLADRVRVLTGDLAHWVSRSTTMRAAGLGSFDAVGDLAEAPRESSD